MKIYLKHYNNSPSGALRAMSLPKMVVEALLKRKIMLISLAVLVIALPLLYLVFKYQSTTQAAWFDDTFAYRQTVAITNAGTAQTDFQVAITLNTSALITAGKMQSDCDDIRVTDVSGKVLPIWIDASFACNTTTTRIWIKASSIPTSGITVYLYYGNPSATNTQNGNNVFDFFDDFSSSTLKSNWTTNGGTWTQSSGIISQTSTTAAEKRIIVNTSSNNYVLEVTMRPDSWGSDYRMGLAARMNSVDGYIAGVLAWNQAYISILDDWVTWGTPQKASNFQSPC